MQITVVLPFPVSANVYWRTRVVGKAAVTYVSAEAKEFKYNVQKALRASGIVNPLSGRVSVSIRLYPNLPKNWESRKKKLGDAWHDGVRCIDLDNCIKVTLDAMKGIAFLDDVWVRKIDAERMAPDGEARMVVTVSQIKTDSIE